MSLKLDLNALQSLAAYTGPCPSPSPCLMARILVPVFPSLVEFTSTPILRSLPSGSIHQRGYSWSQCVTCLEALTQGWQGDTSYMDIDARGSLALLGCGGERKTFAWWAGGGVTGKTGRGPVPVSDVSGPEQGERLPLLRLGSAAGPHPRGSSSSHPCREESSGKRAPDCSLLSFWP